jgi:adenosylhomocysteinase
MLKPNQFDVKDLALSPQGKLKIEWANRQMPVLNLIKERFIKEKPFAKITIAACLHATAETANLMLTLKAGGARVVLYNTNPLSTQDEVAASLVKDYEIPTFAMRDMPPAKYEQYVNTVLDFKPNITLDDGADLIATLHSKRQDLLPHVMGGTEETTTGVTRVKSLDKHGLLKYPFIAVNDSKTKYMFDNRYGTGQSTIDGILRAANVLLAGSTFVVCGYGWCSRGIAMRAHGMGAHVIVTEVDPIKALEATMDGFMVMPLVKAAKLGDIFITATGNKHVIDEEDIKVMKDGAIMGNSGHFNVEINLDYLHKQTKQVRRIRHMLDEYLLKDGRRLYLIGEGRLTNLTAAEGHPAMVMDMSFADQALSAEYLVKNYQKMKHQVYNVPEAITNQVATLKLKSMGVNIDKLTPEQKKYLAGWEEGAFTSEVKHRQPTK